MANPNSPLIHLCKLPVTNIPFVTASEKYGGQVAALLDQLAESRADIATKAMDPKKMKWGLVCERSADPPHITDWPAFVSHLAANSRFYLKMVAGKVIKFEEIFTPPAQFMAQFEQRARLITNSRRDQAESPSILSVVQEPRHPLLETLDNWCQNHEHDSRLARIARCTLEQLIDSVTRDE